MGYGENGALQPSPCPRTCMVKFLKYLLTTFNLSEVRFPQKLPLKMKAEKLSGTNGRVLFFNVCSGVKMYALRLFHIERKYVLQGQVWQMIYSDLNSAFSCNSALGTRVDGDIVSIQLYSD
jgi:hypothetical protein